MRIPIIIVGAGGHARAVAALIQQLPQWALQCVWDRSKPREGETIGGVPVIGGVEVTTFLGQRGVTHLIIGLGDNDERKAAYAEFMAIGMKAPVLCHPTAIVDPSARLGAGTIVCPGAIIGAEVVVGENCIINSGSIIEHETQIGSHAHIAPGVCIAGRTRIGDCTMVGIGASLKEKVTIGQRTIIGAGSVVLSDVPNDAIAFGAPARVSRLRGP